MTTKELRTKILSVYNSQFDCKKTKIFKSAIKTINNEEILLFYPSNKIIKLPKITLIVYINQENTEFNNCYNNFLIYDEINEQIELLLKEYSKTPVDQRKTTTTKTITSH